MAKGAQFERDVCRQLSLWWSGDRRDDIFWRTSQSGGRATSRAKKGKKTRGQEGDVSATDPSGLPFLRLFTLELKRGYVNARPADILDAAPNAAQQPFDKFLWQAMTASVSALTPYWMVIHKRDGRLPLVYFPIRFWEDLKKHPPYSGYIEYKFRLKSKTTVRFVGMRLESFCTFHDPGVIKEFYKRSKNRNGS